MPASCPYIRCMTMENTTMTKTFRQEHPEYARIASHIERARAQHALEVGEAIGNGLVAIAHAARNWRVLFHTGSRKPA